jgi:glycosyltransferase involved in cell wall biosynthesis
VSQTYAAPRAAIYDRWLKTAGGGEKHAGAIAEVLSRDHQVEFLTHLPVDLSAIASALNLDLAGVSVRYVPDSPDAVTQASGDYDLFVNASHLDYVAARARRNALVVYFPASTVAAATALGSYNRVVAFARNRIVGAMGSSARIFLRRVIFDSTMQSSDQTLLGRLAIRIFRLLSSTGEQDSLLNRYGAILAISEYTRRWIRRYWHRESLVLYPRIDSTPGDDSGRRPAILTVGRFFAGNHNKKHIDLIRAFQALHDQLPGWRLHVVGAYAPTDSNAAYLRAVEAAALGDESIELHVNCNASELARLYRECRMYWHATGLGESELEHPERFEHFGITVVEAMVAGTVPLVLGAGGLPEIVQSDVDGIIWKDAAELRRESVALARDQIRWERLSGGARRRATNFDGRAFERRLAQALRHTEAVRGRD